MRTKTILALVVANIVMGSLAFKYYKANALRGVSVRSIFGVQSDGLLYILAFFSIRDCQPCLDVLNTLGSLPSDFRVIGIIPPKEVRFEKEIREKTGAKFELVFTNKLGKYYPNSTPAIMGLNREGDILFILPGVPGESSYIKDFLENVYRRYHQIL